MVLTTGLLFLFACGSPDAPAERTDGFSQTGGDLGDSLFTAVMHGHDTAMARMGKIERYGKEVEAKLDSLKKTSGSAKASLEKALGELRADLRTAEESMNKWMDDFDIDSAQAQTSRRIDYLRSEKIKVDDVKEKVLRAVSRADSLLRKK